MTSLADSDFSTVALLPVDFRLMAKLVEEYADLPLCTTGASLIALAERLDVTEIATLDRPHLTVVRPSHVEVLQQLP